MRGLCVDDIWQLGIDIVSIPHFSCGGILVATPTGVCVAMIEGRCSLRAVERGPQSCAVCGMAFVSASSAPTTASGDSVRQHR